MTPTLCIATLSIASFACSIALRAQQEEEREASAQTPISSVSMSFVPGALTMSSPYAIILKKDGSAVYVVRRQNITGTFRAKGLTEAFGEVTKALAECTYWNLQNHFGPIGHTNSSVVVTIKSSATSKSIVDAGKIKGQNQGGIPPAALKHVEQILGGLTASAHWDKISDKADFSGFPISGG
jgi:hypothetical protein